MEAATIEPTVQEPEAALVEATATAVEATPQKMFRFSMWVHVGDGAEECPHVVGEANEKHQGEGCEDSDHFHAFCRLPNQFQHRDIVEKATAARARRIRLLNDTESDAYEVLESTLRAIRADGNKDAVIEELLGYSWQEDYLQSLSEVEEEEQFEHIGQDREEYRRLLQMEEEKRPKDQFEALERLLQAYVDRTQEKLTEIQAPRKQAFEGVEVDDLMRLLRDRRVEADGEEEYQHVFAMWEWFVGTKQPDRQTQKYTKIEAMTADEAPEVIEMLQATFQTLRVNLQKGSPGGNS